MRAHLCVCVCVRACACACLYGPEAQAEWNSCSANAQTSPPSMQLVSSETLFLGTVAQRNKQKMRSSIYSKGLCESRIFSRIMDSQISSLPANMGESQLLNKSVNIIPSKIRLKTDVTESVVPNKPPSKQGLVPFMKEQFSLIDSKYFSGEMQFRLPDLFHMQQSLFSGGAGSQLEAGKREDLKEKQEKPRMDPIELSRCMEEARIIKSHMNLNP